MKCSVRTLQGVAKWHQKTMAVNISEKSSVFTSAKSKYRIMQEENGGIRRFRPLSSSPLPYTVFAPTLFEFDPTKSSSPPD